jgi:hypothetical protein
MSDTIPYTHWAYFPDEASAHRCAKDLADYVIRIRPATDEAPLRWLLLAGRDVEVGQLIARHNELEEIVTRHGGQYDFGEATYADQGRPIADPLLTSDWGDEHA